MIYDRTAATHIIGSLVQNPSLLVDSDKYALSPLDFTEKIHSILFSVVNNLYFSGIVKIDVLVIEDYLKKYPEIYETYLKNHGTDFLIAAIELAELSNFDFYYDRVKKMTLLRDLKESGFNIQDWYIEDVYDISKRQQMELKLEKATIKEILQSIQNKLYGIESDFVNKKNFAFQNIYEGIRGLLDNLKIEPAIGLPFSTEIFSTITFGARKKKYYLLSGDTGTGKSRTALENMFHLSIPIRWNIKKGDWEISGSNQKSIFISTELDFTELQLPALAYITGIDEGLIKTFQLTEQQKQRIEIALNILEHFQDNIYLYHMPDPTIQQLTTSVKQKIVQHEIDNVFFDYIHTSPQLLAEFRASGLREDVVLNMVSTALKNLANEMDVFVWSGTQLNAGAKEADFVDVGNLRGQIGPDNILSSLLLGLYNN